MIFPFPLATATLEPEPTFVIILTFPLIPYKLSPSPIVVIIFAFPFAKTTFFPFPIFVIILARPWAITLLAPLPICVIIFAFPIATTFNIPPFEFFISSYVELPNVFIPSITEFSTFIGFEVISPLAKNRSFNATGSLTFPSRGSIVIFRSSNGFIFVIILKSPFTKEKVLLFLLLKCVTIFTFPYKPTPSSPSPTFVIILAFPCASPTVIPFPIWVMILAFPCINAKVNPSPTFV